MDPSVVAAIFLGAMAFESSSKGIVMAFMKARTNPGPGPRIILFVDLLGVALSIAYIVTLVVTNNCVATGLTYKILFHCFFTGFDAFLLYKTLIVSQMKSWVGITSAILLVHKAVWIFLDLIRSYNTTIDGACSLRQDQLSLFGFSAADLVIDIFATAVTIWSAVSELDRASTRLAKLYQVLVADNVLRSVSIILLAAFVYVVTYGYENNVDWANKMVYVIPSFSFYVIVQCLNAEFFWMSRRTDVMTKQEDYDD